MLLKREIDTSKEILLLGIFATLRVGTQIKRWTREIVPNTENDAAARKMVTHAQSVMKAHSRQGSNLGLDLSCSKYKALVCVSDALLYSRAQYHFLRSAPSVPPSLPHFPRPLTRTSASAPPVASTPHGWTSALSTGSFLPASPPCHVICGVVIFIACL